MTDPMNPYLQNTTDAGMGGQRGLVGGLHQATAGLRGMLPQSPIGSALGLPSPMGNQGPMPQQPMGPPPIPAPQVSAPMPAPPAPAPPQQVASNALQQMPQPMGKPAGQPGGFNPRQMVRAQGAARGAQMERMARPTGARQGLAMAKATGNLPGGPPKPPQY